MFIVGNFASGQFFGDRTKLMDRDKRSIMRLMLGGLIVGLLLDILPVQAQITSDRTIALVEALRLAAPKRPTEEDGLYSDWKIKPSLIPRWSLLCINEELTPEEFETDDLKARLILMCVMEDVLKREYPASNNDEYLAIRRAAAWWVAGNAELYNIEPISGYADRVLNYYQELQANPSDFLPYQLAKESNSLRIVSHPHAR